MVTFFVACVNGFHGSKHNIVYLCKQECLWMGYEHQYKQSILNMTDNRVANNHPSLRACTTVFKYVEKIYLFYTVLQLWACFETNHSSKAFTSWLQDVMATYHSGGLQRSWQGSGAQCFVYAITIELSQLKECSKQPHQVLFACGHTALTYTVGDFLFTVMSVDCLSYSLTKWNFHFLVCKWVSPSAFVWYLFIQCMWQEQCTLINISAFTSL